MEMEAFMCGRCGCKCEVPTKKCGRCKVTFAGLLSNKQWAHDFYNQKPEPAPAQVSFNGSDVVKTIHEDEFKHLHNELDRKKLHLEYLRCAIAEYGGDESVKDSMDDLWSMMDESQKAVMMRDLIPLKPKVINPQVKKAVDDALNCAYGNFVGRIGGTAERMMVSRVLDIMAKKVEKEWLKGFTISWDMGSDVEIAERITPPSPMDFITTTVVLGKGPESTK